MTPAAAPTFPTAGLVLFALAAVFFGVAALYPLWRKDK